MKNPIINELTTLNLISKSRLIHINNITSDKKIKVIQDFKTKVIFLEKYVTTNKYYSTLKYNDHDRKILKKKKKSNVRVLNGYIKIPIIEDDHRRSTQFSKILKKKKYLILVVAGVGS